MPLAAAALLAVVINLVYPGGPSTSDWVAQLDTAAIVDRVDWA